MSNASTVTEGWETGSQGMTPGRNMPSGFHGNSRTFHWHIQYRLFCLTHNLPLFSTGKWKSFINMQCFCFVFCIYASADLRKQNYLYIFQVWVFNPVKRAGIYQQHTGYSFPFGWDCGENPSFLHNIHLSYCRHYNNNNSTFINVTLPFLHLNDLWLSLWIWHMITFKGWITDLYKQRHWLQKW